MGINFDKPFVLLLIPILIIGIVLSSKWLLTMSKGRRRSLMIIRSVIVTLLILSYCGTDYFWKVKDITTIFLIDASDSTLPKRKDMENFIKEASKDMGPRDQIAVVSFGDNSQVESFISKEQIFSKVEGKINGNYTNIENAIATSLSLFPNNTNKRIVLISDGEENSGAVSKVALSLKEQGIELKYHKIEKEQGNEVAVESVTLPQRLALEQEFNLYVSVSSTSDQEAKLHLYSGRTKVGEQKVQLNKGINKFIFKDKALIGGFKSYKVVVEADNDLEMKNNEGSTFTTVTAKPKILVIQDVPEDAVELIKILEASSLDYTVLNSKAAPRILTELTSYKSIITCNVSADNLNDGFLNSLESYVKDFGGGFIATGGDNSFALGGYSKTSLEKVLPVYMDMRGKKEIPKMSMVLVIDKSGSMTEGMAGISKVDMAKEAAIRSLESLRKGKDEIGVLAFDGTYSWVVKRQIINDSKAIEEDIGTIRADGGTSILPALEEGYKALKDSDAKIKHIILLTDGQAEKTGYEALLKNINDNNITVSTVAVGKDADISLLQIIAKNCGGRHYITDEFTNIPRIFSKETFMASRTYLNNKEFTPVINNEHIVLRGVSENGLPSLLGYIGSSQKEMARVILSSDEEDPILTVWQYGLGKTAAWNSDITGKWSSNYIPWDKNLKLWQNIINYTVENYDNENASMEVNAKGGRATITFKDKISQEEVDTKAVVVTPSGENKEIQLYPSAPGEYSGEIDLKDSGTYMFNGKQVKNGDVINSVNTGYSLQYSPEYKINNNSEVLDKVVLDLGGSMIASPQEVFKNDIAPIKGVRDLTPFLLAIASILFIFDVAIRRLRISMYRIRTIANKLKLFRTKFKVKKTASKVFFKENEVSDNISKAYINEDVYENHNLEETVINAISENTIKLTDKTITQNEADISKNLSALDTYQLLKNKKFKR